MKRILSCFLTIFFSFSLFGDWGGLSYSEAKGKFDSGDRSPEFLFNYAKLLIESKRYKEVGEVLPLLKKNKEWQLRAKLLEAEVLIEKGDFKSAKTLCSAIISSARKDPMGYVCMGRAFLVWRRGSRAIEQFEKGLKLKEDSVDAYVGLGDSYRMMGEYEKAQYYYNKALEIDSNCVKAALGLGLIYVTRGDRKRGVEYFRKAVEARPNLGEAHFYLGKYLGDTEEAVEELKKATSLVLNWGEALYELGMLLSRLERWEEAISYLSQFLELAPTKVDAWVSLGEAYLNKGNLTSSEEALKKALKLVNNLPEAHRLLGEVYFKMGNYKEAEDEYKIAIDTAPGDPVAKYKMGELMRYLNRNTVAINYLEEASTIAPEFSAPQVLLGDIYFDRKNWEKALQHYKEAMRRSDKRWVDMNHLKERLEQLKVKEKR